MRNRFFITLFFLSVVHFSYSQNTKKSDKHLLKAKTYLADNDIANSELFLKKSIEENPANYDAYAVLGNLYFSLNKFEYAVNNFRKSDSIYSENYLKYKLANSFFMMGDYVNAKKYFKVYLKKAPSYYKGAKIAKKRIANCDFAIEQMKHPVDFNPINIGDGINTTGYEYNPVVSADGHSLIYTGVRTKHGKKVEDFYISKLKNGVWQKGVPLPGSVNTNENEGAHCISVDGKFLYFTSCGRVEGIGSCDIYISIRVDNKWSNAINLGRGINTSAWDAHPALSPDGRTLVFSSTRSGGKGKKDLWIAKYRNGAWCIPKNIAELNTKGDEVTPYFHADGKTLYFSSDGLPGMGGMDFFVSHYDENIRMWSTPINLGYRINSSRDEYSLMVARDGKTAYFSTDAIDDGQGEMDIYSFVLGKNARGANTAYLQGRIVELSNKRNIPNSELLIVDLKTSKPMNTVYVENGNYKALLPIGRTYAIVAKSPRHFLYSETFEFVTDSVNNFMEKDFKLTRVRKGLKMNLHNINFESGKSEILKESYFELDLLVAFLKKYSKYRAKVIGHTDDVGSKESNQKLSLDRANSVRDYLISKGISPKKLKPIGKGETQPISKNESSEGRKKNRRTEIILF
jgi:flagellar motor protein MotB